MSISWESKFKNSEKLRKRAFKGVPNKVRGRFWGLFLDLPTIKEQQKGIYEVYCCDFYLHDSNLDLDSLK